MTTIRFEEAKSESMFRAGLACFTYYDYEANNLDYLTSGNPFSYIYECSKNNSSLFHWYSKIMIDDAVSKGTHYEQIYHALSMLEIFIEFDTDTTTTPVNRTTLERDGRRIPLNLGDEYEIDNGAIYYIKGGRKELICRHLILPVGVQINRDNATERIEIADNHDGNWWFRTMAKSVAFKSSGIIALVDYGIDISQGTAKKISSFLQTVEFLNRENLPVTYVSDHLGWNDNFSEFVPYDERVQYSKAHENPDEYACLSTSKGTQEEWLDLFKGIRDDKHIPERIALATSFASVLIKPMSTSPFMLDIWGGAGIGKSTLLTAAASIWAYPGMDGAYISTFNATPIANEQKALLCCDFPLILDEMQTIQNKKSYEEYVYKLCEGKPRGRATSSGGLRSQGSWHNTILVTGEQPIVTESSMGGAQRRVVNLECTEKLFNGEYTALWEHLRNCYGTAGRQFIDHLLSEGYMQWAHDQFEENKTAIKQHANSSQNIPGALILTADALAEAWIFKDGVRLTVEDVVTYLKSDIVQDMYEQTHNTIAQWIISNKRYIIPAGKLDMPNGNRAIGRHMTLKGVDVCAILHTEFKSMMQTKGLKLEGYLSWAAKNGKIVTAKDGRSYMNNVKFLVGGKSVQASCYVFPITQLNVIEETEDASELIIISETVDVDGTVSTVGTRMS